MWHCFFCCLSQNVLSHPKTKIIIVLVGDKLPKIYFVVRPWLHQQSIKRLKPTSQLRLKHQSEQFWVAEKTTKRGGALKRPAPLCVFLGSQNSSNCCFSLVFVGFNLLILCWLAGANDEVHSFKFNLYFLTFETWASSKKLQQVNLGQKLQLF